MRNSREQRDVRRRRRLAARRRRRARVIIAVSPRNPRVA
jgi:hypothetical protein